MSSPVREAAARRTTGVSAFSRWPPSESCGRFRFSVLAAMLACEPRCKLSPCATPWISEFHFFFWKKKTFDVLNFSGKKRENKKSCSRYGVELDDPIGGLVSGEINSLTLQLKKYAVDVRRPLLAYGAISWLQFASQRRTFFIFSSQGDKFRCFRPTRADWTSAWECGLYSAAGRFWVYVCEKVPDVALICILTDWWPICKSRRQLYGLWTETAACNMELFGLFCLCWTVSSAATYGKSAMAISTRSKGKICIKCLGHTRGQNKEKEIHWPHRTMDTRAGAVSTWRDSSAFHLFRAPFFE